MTRQQVFSWFFIGIFLLLIYLIFEVLSPFFLPLFWAAILVIVLYPLQERLTKLFGNRAWVSSFVMTVIVTFLLVIPVLVTVFLLSLEVVDIYRAFDQEAELGRFKTLLERLKESIPPGVLERAKTLLGVGKISVEEMGLKLLGSVSNYLLDQVQRGVANITAFLFNFSIMVLGLYFFFRDGRSIYSRFIYLIPMADAQKGRISSIMRNTLESVVVGNIATAAAQGLLVGVVFWILGLSFPVLAGGVSFVLSILPILGAVFVWFPVGIYLLFVGSTAKGIVLLVFGALVVSSVDNFLRPMIIGGRAKLHTLFLLLSIMGGIGAFGISGVILGPVLLAIFMGFIEIYESEYRREGR